MKVIILTCNSELESAKKLGYENTVTILNGITDQYKTDLVVRWGNGAEYVNQFGSASEFPNAITNYKNIELNCSKHECSKKLSEVVLTPKLWTKNIPRGKLAVYRPTAHASGKDFKVVKGSFNIEPNHYATEFIKSDREIRVWYCNGKTMAARRVTKNQKRLSEEFKCRSLWSYKIWKKTPKHLHKKAIKAANHLGFKYGAFDIIISKDNKYYFLENNTAPSLDHSKIIKFYQRGLKSIVNKKSKELTKEWKKNPPLEIQFKVSAFQASPEVLKKLQEEKYQQQLIKQKQNAKVIPLDNQKVATFKTPVFKKKLSAQWFFSQPQFGA